MGSVPPCLPLPHSLQMPAWMGGQLIWTPKTSQVCGATTRNNSTTTTWNYTGGSPGFSKFARAGGRQDSDDRQHGELWAKSRIRGQGDSVAHASSIGRGFVFSLGQTVRIYQTDSQAHARTPECLCRSPVMTASNLQHQVESFSTTADSCVVPMGPTAHGCLCHGRERPTAKVCCTSLLDPEAWKVDAF